MFYFKTKFVTSEDGSVQWVVVEWWASNEAMMILVREWGRFVFGPASLKISAGSVQWDALLWCSTMKIRWVWWGSSILICFRSITWNCYRDELMWWAVIWLWVVMKLRWSVMDLRCASLLATRPYACNYMEFSFQGKFLLSCNRTIFVIFMTPVADWNRH